MRDEISLIEWLIVKFLIYHVPNVSSNRQGHSRNHSRGHHVLRQTETRRIY